MRTPILPVLIIGLVPHVAFAQGEAPIEDLLKVYPDGLTADRVSERAVSTSYVAKSYEAAVRSAEMRADAAWLNFFPRASGLARYTRLSELTPPVLGGGFNIVVTSAPPGTMNPSVISGGALTFPVVLNNWTFQGTLVVPISDYFLRINQAYTSATSSRDAARYDLATQRARAGADARVAFYSWLRARAGQVVNKLAYGEKKAHLTDAQNIFTVGRASKADVLRAETGVAAVELAIERQKNLVDYLEMQLRIAMHDPADAPYLPGESLETEIPTFQGNLQQLIQEARTARPEVKSIDCNIEAASKTASVQRAGMFPSLNALANVTLANPNQRVFPQADYFFTTWDASIQLTWSPNDAAISNRQSAAIEAQVDQLMAQKEATRDGITLEVTQAFQLIKEAQVSIDVGKRILASAQEAYRVAHELFVNGSGTSTTLADAEGELNNSRLGMLNAQVDLRIARVRLEHAVGRDVPKLMP